MLPEHLSSMKACKKIILFLAREKMLTEDLITLLWDQSINSSIERVEAVHEVVEDLAETLPYDGQRFLFKMIQARPCLLHRKYLRSKVHLYAQCDSSCLFAFPVRS